MTQDSRAAYPFTAVVGMEKVKEALECAVASPHIHSVLVRGKSGCAKTVLSRSVADVCGLRIVNCPLGVTDDQLYGGIDMEKAVGSGKIVLEKGLLARADGGILYIDDVNLLDRSMLACILDAASTGKINVERGPISAECKTSFTLIATMNPEDDDLSDHMLDRFDLCAYADDADTDGRKDILVRNASFSEDPGTFRSEYSGTDSEERKKIERASRILPLVTISEPLSEVVSELCVKVGADSLRADIAVIECAKTVAALDGRDEVSKKDVEEAAALCLPHRRSYAQPPEEPPAPPEPPEDDSGDGEDDETQRNDGEDDDRPDEPPPQDRNEDKPEHDGEDGEDSPEDLFPDIEKMLFEIGRQFRVIDYIGSRERVPSRTKTRKGRRALAESADGTGRYARSRIPNGKTSDIAFDATLRAAAPYQKTRESDGLAITVEKRDIREKVRERRSGTTIMFLVDASGSLGVRKRMSTVKGTVMSMLRDSYVRRDRIGLAAFRRTGAEVLLPPTKSVEYSYKCLEDMPTGGKTPLSGALTFMADYMNSYMRSHVGERCFVVLITDGRGNVPLREGDNANDEAIDIAENLHTPGLGWIVVDASSGFIRFDNAQKIAMALEGKYFRLEDMDADAFASGIRSTIE